MRAAADVRAAVLGDWQADAMERMLNGAVDPVERRDAAVELETLCRVCKLLYGIDDQMGAS